MAKAMPTLLLDNEIDDFNQLISLVGTRQAENKIKELISEFIKKN